jgi:hypothetical protein
MSAAATEKSGLSNTTRSRRASIGCWRACSADSIQPARLHAHGR